MTDLTTEPTIIMGHPRSGSTLLAHTMNAHKKVYITDESRSFLGAHRVTQPLMARESFESEFMPILKAKVKDAIVQFHSQVTPDGTVVWGDKFPHYCDDSWGYAVEGIDAMFPKAHYVFLTRNKDAVLESIRKKGWHGNGPWYDALMDRGRELKVKFGPRLLWLNYEDGIEYNCEKFLQFKGLSMDRQLKQKIKKEASSDKTRYSAPTSW